MARGIGHRARGGCEGWCAGRCGLGGVGCHHGGGGLSRGDVGTHLTRVLGNVRRGLAVPEVDGLMGVVCTGLVNACCGGGTGTLVDC